MNHLIQLATAEEGGGGNFLVPNWTFVFELISFGIIMFILAKYVIPPINKAMTERQEKIKAQFDEAAQPRRTRRRLRRRTRRRWPMPAPRPHASVRRLASRARRSSSSIVSRRRSRPNGSRRTPRPSSRSSAPRRSAQLKGEVGAIATTLAGRIVGESLEDDKRQKRSVERFIAELEDEGKPKKSGNAKSKN